MHECIKKKEKKLFQKYRWRFCNLWKRIWIWKLIKFDKKTWLWPIFKKGSHIHPRVSRRVLHSDYHLCSLLLISILSSFDLLLVFSIILCHDFSQKIKFSIEGFLSKCDQIRRKLRRFTEEIAEGNCGNWSDLLKKPVMELFTIHTESDEILVLVLILSTDSDI